MTCRRKTRNEKELLADIHKTFTIYCKKNDCISCKYKQSYNCELDYVVDLLEKDNKEA